MSQPLIHSSKQSVNQHLINSILFAKPNKGVPNFRFSQGEPVIICTNWVHDLLFYLYIFMYSLLKQVSLIKSSFSHLNMNFC